MIIAVQTLLFFRQSLLSALDRFLSPYYKRLTLTFTRSSPEIDDEDEEVYSEFDDEKGVVFYPPMYAQRYAAVSDCLMDERWCGKLEKVVDLGYHDMSFIKYLKELPGIRCILGVDIESIPLRCSSDLLGCDDYSPKREHPLQVTLFQGNAADPDYRLIGCDAVVAIEMIEHMLPHDLDRLVHTVFGFIKPRIAVFTTPNGDFNVLFKSMEKNGFRRLDHFFEWSREQFHDWCSNIVARYPNFSVTCQGIGPGPAGTHHHGCCSQLALFVNKKYVKQQDWNLNSLALVSNVPSPQNVAEMVGGWESPFTEPENMMYPQNAVGSLTDFLYSEKQSCMTILIASPTYSISTLEYKDKMSQCNLETERAKSFVMFNDEEMCFTVLVPRRKFVNRVYEIEDVASRLNCTTFQVKKFSKLTQNLMAKNRVDSLVHTREVVSEIRHLTKMLNFNGKDALMEKGDGHIWCNINWGENAPYWNQYYKVVREYNYPFEVKSEESRILDLITEEINRRIDATYDEQCSAASRLEIPMPHLMDVVGHITDDVDRVKDLLEWNGYEIEGDIVIHSRMVVDNVSTSYEDEWPENDTVSELESTDIQSTTISDGSTIAPDYHGRCIRRALDKKVRALRAMMSADEDITTELDHVVCRLMKLALRTSKGKQAAPPTRWMECKLLDLLTLTEKAISRRKRHYLENFSFEAIGYGYSPSKFSEICKLKDDDADANRIMTKYNHLLENGFHSYDPLDFGYDDGLEDASKELNLDDLRISNEAQLLKGLELEYPPEKRQAWINEDPLGDIDQTTKTMSSSDHNSTSNSERYRHIKRSHKRIAKPKEGDKKIRKRSYSKIIEETPKDDTSNIKKSRTSLRKLRNKSTSNTRVYPKKVVNDYGTYGVTPKKLLKEYKKLQPTASKPIPGSLIELCHPELMQTNTKEFSYSVKDRKPIQSKDNDEVAATKESVLIDIVMDDMQETIALRRSIGTEPDLDDAAVEQELIFGTGNVNKSDSLSNKFPVDADVSQSQTIFLYDINEPSTSKGVRHVSMDVQCGTDTAMPYGMVTPPSSVTRMPKIFSNGIKIEDSMTNVTSRNNSVDLGAQRSNDIQNFGPVCSRRRSPPLNYPKGIKIEDSLNNLNSEKKSSDFATSTEEKRRGRSPTTRATRIRIKDSLLEIKLNKQGGSGAAANEKCGSVSPKRKFSGIMPNMISEENNIRKSLSPRLLSPNKKTFGIIIQDSRSDLRSRKSFDYVEECITISPRSRSPDVFVGLSVDDSLTNVLANFEATASPHQRPRSRPVSPRRWSPIVRTKGIKKELRTNNSDISTRGSKEKKFASSMADIRLTTNSDRPSACRIVSPRVKSPLKFNIMASKLSHTSDIGTSINDVDESVSNPTKAQSATDKSNLKNPDFSGFSEPTFDESFGLKSTQVNEMNSADVSESHNNLTLRTRCFGFKVKDVDENLIKKVEFSTTRVELLSDGNAFPSIELGSSTQTETLKPVSSTIKTENSSSEFCSYCCVSPKSPADLTSVYGNQEAFNRDIEVAGAESPTRARLSCGGVHIHSYKEKQSSEDIVYQGEWQRQIRRPLKKQCLAKSNKKTPEVSAKKINSKKTVAKDQKLVKKTCEKRLEIKTEPKKPVNVRNMKLVKVKQEIVADKKPTLAGLTKSTKVKNLTKVPASKIGMNSITSKNVRISFTSKKNVSSTPIKRDCDINAEIIKGKKNELVRKSYLPAYLKKKKLISDQCALNQSFDTIKTFMKLNKHLTKANLTLPRIKAENIKADLLKVQDDPMNNISYLVFRNELENNTNANNGHSADNSDGTTKKRSNTKRSSSPLSATSSACSTPDSVATVKVMSKMSSRRHSTSSNKSSIAASDTEAPPSTNRNRKLVKRSKTSNKKDKENIPETSKPINPTSVSNQALKNVKSAFGHSRSVFMAFANDGLDNKHASNKSNVKIPVVENNEDIKKSKPGSISKKSLQSHGSSCNEEVKKQDSFYSEISNIMTLLEDQSRVQETVSQPFALDEQGELKGVDSNLLSEWLESVGTSQKESSESAILAAMRQIVEGRLDFINFMESKNSSFEDCYDIDDTSSLKSYKTVVPSDHGNLNSTLKSEIENAMNRSFEAIATRKSGTSLGDETDMDGLSFKSVTSVSKYSDYFLADNQYMDDKEPAPKTANALSVQDIFERKDLTLIQNAPGPLAIQAFSGFSMNVDPVVGDHQPDYVNLIDSETGSMAVVGRQATSEELLVSGRSSESYESCLIDEDAVVPNWLFQIISQQQSMQEEENLQELVPLSIPLVEPVFDVNGNVVEPNVGLGAGAGDGRGMHSDHSQDSSGRGSSLSTTDTSSGQQSEAILIDPSAFTGQYELHEPIGSSMAVTTLVLPADSPGVRQGHEMEHLTSRTATLRIRPNPLLVSDGEADVSSLDTDVPDSN